MSNILTKPSKSLFYFAFALVLYEFTLYSANDMIMPGMLMVVKEFNAPISYVAASLSLYLLGDSLLQLFLGPLADKYGKRKIILIGASLFLAFTVLLAATTSINSFMLGRFLQGSCMAFIAMGYAIIHESFDDKTAVKVTALMANVSILAPLIGPVIGGVIVNYVSWRYIFVISAITGIIALVGLTRYTPPPKNLVSEIKFSSLIINYKEILSNRTFLLGALGLTFSIIPALIWIGVAPTMIMHTYHLNVNYYMLYQAIAISGIMVNSLVIQFIAGNLAMVRQVYYGIILASLGVILVFMLHFNLLLLSIAMFINTFGLGLGNAIVFRVLGKLPVKSSNMLFSMLTFINTLLMALGIEVANQVLAKFTYSTLNFSLLCLAFGLTGSYFMYLFSKQIKSRSWE